MIIAVLNFTILTFFPPVSFHLNFLQFKVGEKWWCWVECFCCAFSDQHSIQISFFPPFSSQFQRCFYDRHHSHHRDHHNHHQNNNYQNILQNHHTPSFLQCLRRRVNRQQKRPKQDHKRKLPVTLFFGNSFFKTVYNSLLVISFVKQKMLKQVCISSGFDKYLVFS